MSTPATQSAPHQAAATSTAVSTHTSLDAVLRPVRSGNAFEEAIQRIMQAIKLGAVTTGERLPPERVLARRLGISRVTLREALRALTDAGMVESRRGRSGGTFITYRPEEQEFPLPTADAVHVQAELEDSLMLRAVLEPGAAEMAARRTLDDDLVVMLKDRLEAVTAATGDRTHRLADARFHLAVAELTGSVSVIAAVADVQMKLSDLLTDIPALPHNIDRSHEQHAAIVEAILEGKSDHARRHMHEHVSGTAALLRGFLT